MDSLRNETIPRYRQGSVLLNGGAVAILGILFLWISSLLLPEIVFATTIYSYIDEQGTPVLTDNFESIPERYRAKVRVTEQAPKGATDHSAAVKLQRKIGDLFQSSGGVFGAFAPNISGLTHYQSQVLSFGGIVAVICLLARFFGRNQAVRFLSLWCLVMAGLIVPALLFTSQDGPLDRLTGQAGNIQGKQQDRLKQTP
jgi:hypothetical protein